MMTQSNDYAAALRRRRETALRLPPLESGVRDPLDESAVPLRAPSTYSLAPGELIREARRLAEKNWQAWELAARLTLPGSAA
jgi:hypothetical protein